MDAVLTANSTGNNGTRRSSNTANPAPGSEDEDEYGLETLTPEHLFLELHLNVQEKVRADHNVGISPCNAFLKQWDVALVGRDHTIIWNARRELVDRLEVMLNVAQSRIGDLKQLPGASAGVELFRNFIVDMLGRETYVGKCFDYKSESYFRLARVITWELKFLALLVTLLFNYWCFTTCVVYGAIKGKVWMENWTLLSCFCLFFLVVVDMTVEAIMVGYILPTQIMPNVRLAQVMIKRSMAAQTKTALTERNSKAADAVRFSASDYLFVSTLMAREMTHLPEANLVLGYSDPLPHAANAVKRSVGLCPSTTLVIELLLARVSLSSILLYVASFPIFAQRAIVTAPLPILGSLATGALIMSISYGKQYPVPFFIVCSILSGALISWCGKLIHGYRTRDSVGEGDDIELVNGVPSKVGYSDSNVMAVEDHFQKLISMTATQRGTMRGTQRGTQRGTHVASVMTKAPTGLAPAPRRASVSVQVKPWHAPVEKGDEASSCSSCSSPAHSDDEADANTTARAMGRLEELVDPAAAAAAAARPSADEKRAALRRKSSVLFHMEQDADQAEAVLMDCMQARRRQSVVRMEERLAERLQKVTTTVPESLAEAPVVEEEEGEEERNRVVRITRKRRARRRNRTGSESEADEVLNLFAGTAPHDVSVVNNKEEEEEVAVEVIKKAGNSKKTKKNVKKKKKKKKKKQKKVFSRPLEAGVTLITKKAKKKRSKKKKSV
jgi:hypothetical protein